MKRSTLILSLIVVALSIFVVILMTRDRSGTIKKELRDFSVQDTASVDKIFMVTKSNDQVVLTRNGVSWMVNDKYVVRREAIELLLKTIHRIQVKAPVAKSALDNVVTMLATRNTKVEIYIKGKLDKTIYIGGPTQDQIGTFMMLEGSSVPFVVHIPGFIGYLSTRFFTDEKSWRSPLIFNYNFDEIASIKSINNDNPLGSFILNKEKNRFDMQALEGEHAAQVIDTLAVKFFVSNFERVASEFFADEMESEMMDSLNMATPFHVLELTDISGKVTKIEAHRRFPVGQADPEAPLQKYDLERMYARINGSDWVVIQYFVFDQLFRELQFFLPMK
ncbi:MAG: hypothetical protein KAH17_01630 [Bacteroidales bacterium]|nr:hypothetical protein [Bacteroidales bacterium]